MHKSTAWQRFSLTLSLRFHSDTSSIIQSNAKDNHLLNHDYREVMMTLQIMKKFLETLQEQFIHYSNMSNSNGSYQLRSVYYPGLGILLHHF